jgi:hypothetical protein
MGDGIGYEMITGPFKEASADWEKRTHRATLYALRATGRKVASRAKKCAPVYKGNDPRAQAEAGNLRKSIQNARKIHETGGQLSFKTGVIGTQKKGTEVVRHGTRRGVAIDSRTARHLGIEGPKARSSESSGGQVRGVLLYRAKMEAKYGFMEKAFAEVDMPRIYDEALTKALAKYK